MHVGDRSFGIDKIESDEPTLLDEVLSKSDKILDSIPAQIVARECYDDYFGVADSSEFRESNYSLIALHDAEDVCAVDSFDVYMDRYLAANVLKFTGINFSDFLKLSRERAEAILKRCDAVASKEDTAVQNMLNDATGKRT